VGLELYRSQTADQVIEVYRRAVSEYGVPKEVLTDQGRQYTSWRGATRFERELVKDRVKHIKSQAHHPMTLGKIERFWKTIFEEFLVRAQFGSFEEAQERVRHWVRYYNHKRPHQGIGGLCPADRYFEIQGELRKTIERGIEENVLEMALRGKPREPFYMVGRMEGQSVVLRAEKGKLRLIVDDEEGGKVQEMVYEVKAGEGREDRGGKGREAQGGEAEDGGEKRAEDFGAYAEGEVLGSVVGIDGEVQDWGGLPGVGGGLEPPSGCIIVEESDVHGERVGQGTEEAASHAEGASGRAEGCPGDKALVVFKENPDGEGEKACAAAGVHHSAGTQWDLDRDGGGPAVGGIAEDVLRMGGACPRSDGLGVGKPSCWTTACPCGRGEGRASAAGRDVGERFVSSGEDDQGQRSAIGAW